MSAVNLTSAQPAKRAALLHVKCWCSLMGRAPRGKRLSLSIRRPLCSYLSWETPTNQCLITCNSESCGVTDLIHERQSQLWAKKQREILINNTLIYYFSYLNGFSQDQTQAHQHNSKPIFLKNCWMKNDLHVAVIQNILTSQSETPKQLKNLSEQQQKFSRLF